MCLCRGSCLYTASGTRLSSITSCPVCIFLLWVLSEGSSLWWMITEMKCLKTQLDFHSSWDVINIWISCCWELISFSSGQVLLCVPATVFVSSVRLGCCSEYGRYAAEREELCRASLCSGLGHVLLILNHQQVQWSLAPVMYGLWNSHLCATSVKQLTSCLWNCTSLGTIKHESWEWDPHGKIEGIDFWLPKGRKTYSPPLCAQECWGPWCNAALVKIDTGLSLICGQVRKMCLANEF